MREGVKWKANERMQWANGNRVYRHYSDSMDKICKVREEEKKRGGVKR